MKIEINIKGFEELVSSGFYVSAIEMVQDAIAEEMRELENLYNQVKNDEAEQ